MLRRYHDFVFTLYRQMPGASATLFPDYERWRANIGRNPRWHSADEILACHGEEWVGVARIARQPDGTLMNGFTGVIPEYRGRGLGFAVKLAGLLHARQLGSPSIATSNHSANAPMLAINHRLGYEKKRGTLSLVRDVTG